LQIVLLVLVLLLAVVVSAFATRLLPLKLPAPLLQMVIGAGFHYAGFEVEFHSHLFLLLFIPPLLFLDGWRIPKGALFRDWRPILALAIGLVVFTVVGIGLFVHWLIPAVPLAVAFALAAILSPTDPVAVGAMTATTPLPSRLTHILEGEALLNDATGLVCFTFAVSAAMTGHFSLANAALSFALVSGGGVAVGLGVTWAIGRLNRALIERAGEEPATQILVSLLMPFAAYLTAEHLHVSGILAAAVAGIAMHYGELAGRALATTRMQRNAVWDTVQATLNGIIFVLLGQQLPHFIERLPVAASEIGVRSVPHLLGYLSAITAALVVLRFVWVWIAMHVTVLRAARLGKQRRVAPTRVLAVTATAGVRGAITLAGILTLPLTLPSGAPFPARDVAIFLAMGVILLSLLFATVALPILTRGLSTLPSAAENASAAARRAGEAAARTAATEAAVRGIERMLTEPSPNVETSVARAEAAMHLIAAYRRRLEYGDPHEDEGEALRVAVAERELHLGALRAEREELNRLRKERGIDDDVHRALQREIDLVEASLTPAAAH
jgi:CPA1 family monovalent cation:H+ antiporter